MDERRWFSGFTNTVFRWREALSVKMSGFDGGFMITLMKKALVAVLTCSLMIGGASVGTIVGAIKGQTTETGLIRGGTIGALSGAITAVQLTDLILHGEPFSKVALLLSLMNGKVFMEWVSPAVLKAYQWQTSSMDINFSEISDIFEITEARGLSEDSIGKLPKQRFRCDEKIRSWDKINCTICLEDYKNGEYTRILPDCRHSFHSNCIDKWLIRQGSCPVCRKDV